MAYTVPGKTIINTVQNILSANTQEKLKEAENALSAHLDSSFKSGETLEVPKELKNFFDMSKIDAVAKLTDTGNNFLTSALVDFVNILITGFAQFAIGLGYMMSSEELAREYGRQKANEDVPITLLSPGEAIQSLFRGLIDDSFTDSQLARAGYDGSKRSILKSLAHELISSTDIAVLANRGILGKDEYDKYLGMLGFRDEDIDNINALRKSYLSSSEARLALYKGVITEDEYYTLMAYEGYSQDQANKFRDAILEYPSPVESLINARHGAFDDSAAERWGLDYEMPDKWLDWMHKNGFSAEVARTYWRGHWAPATNGEILNLYRRRLIDEPLCDEGLTLNGVAQGWHQYVKESAFEYPSYYVIEAMVGISKPDLEKVVEWCKLAGYPDSFVEAIAQGFIKKYEKSSTTGLKEKIKEAALIQGLAGSELYQAFIDIGLSDSEAALEMQTIQIEIELATAKKQIELVQNQYVEGVMTKEEAVKQLILDGIGSQEIDYWMTQWDLMKKAKVRTLSEAQVGELYKKGHISKEDAIKRWENMGYNSVDANLLTLYY